MTGEAKIDAFNSIYNTNFKVVSKISIVQTTQFDRTPEIDLEVDLQPIQLASKRLRIQFVCVRIMRIVQPSLSLFTVPLLTIKLIDDRQWEGLRYQVKDEEEESLSLVCKDFNYQMIE